MRDIFENDRAPVVSFEMLCDASGLLCKLARQSLERILKNAIITADRFLNGVCGFEPVLEVLTIRLKVHITQLFDLKANWGGDGGKLICDFLDARYSASEDVSAVLCARQAVARGQVQCM